MVELNAASKLRWFSLLQQLRSFVHRFAYAAASCCVGCVVDAAASELRDIIASSFVDCLFSLFRPPAFVFFFLMLLRPFFGFFPCTLQFRCVSLMPLRSFVGLV